MEWLHEGSAGEKQFKLPPFCTVQLLIGTKLGPKLLTAVASVCECYKVIDNHESGFLGMAKCL